MWVSVSQRAAELQGVKAGGKKNSAVRPGKGEAGLKWVSGKFFLPPILTAYNSANL